MTLSADDLSFRELRDLEREVGRPFGELFPEGKPSAEGLAGMFWLAQRRTNPAFTFDEALDTKLKVLADNAG